MPRGSQSTKSKHCTQNCSFNACLSRGAQMVQLSLRSAESDPPKDQSRDTSKADNFQTTTSAVYDDSGMDQTSDIQNKGSGSAESDLSKGQSGDTSKAGILQPSTSPVDDDFRMDQTSDIEIKGSGSAESDPSKGQSGDISKAGILQPSTSPVDDDSRMDQTSDIEIKVSDSEDAQDLDDSGRSWSYVSDSDSSSNASLPPFQSPPRHKKTKFHADHMPIVFDISMSCHSDIMGQSDDSNLADGQPQPCGSTPEDSSLGMMGKDGGKIHYCLYCSKAVCKMARHLEQKHSREIEVSHVLSMKKGSAERKKAWDNIRKKGDFQHNYSCREQKRGKLVPKYRCKRDGARDIDDYVSCSGCLGLYVRDRLWQHQKFCERKPETYEKGVRAGKLLDPVSVNDKQLRDEILVDMKDDEIKKCIENDELIMAFGKDLLEKNSEPHKKAYIANKLRELGRLVKCGQSSGTLKSIKEAIDPHNFESVVQAVRSVAGINADKSFDSPSTALKLGYSLISCCKLLHSKALIECDEALKLKCQNFKELYTSQWASKISSHALRTLDTRKFNNPKRLPFVTDCVKLQNHLKIKAEEAKNLVEIDPVEGSVELAQVTLAQVILFNRRRSGESQRLKVEEFKAAMKIDKENAHEEEIINSLTEFEKKLYASHCKVETRGKRGRRVPIILTEDMKKSICTLLKHRDQVGIESSYLFSKPGCRYPIRGCDVLNRFSKEADLAAPELMTSTRLRQQLGTHCQVLGLSENSQDILATFMGHDIRVHRTFYRLPDNVLQLAKVSKVLHAINSGKMSQLQGKDFDSISFDLEDNLEEENSDEEDEEPNDPDGDCLAPTELDGDCLAPTELTAGNCAPKRKLRTFTSSSSRDSPAPTGKLRTFTSSSSRDSSAPTGKLRTFTSSSSRNSSAIQARKRKYKQRQDDYCFEESEDSDERFSDDDFHSSSAGFKKKRKVCRKRPWSSLEIRAVENALGSFLKRLCLPGKRDIERAQEKENELKNRSWTNIKYYIKNRITAMKRKSCK